MGAVFEPGLGLHRRTLRTGYEGARLIQFPFPTVGGTENLLMAASPGRRARPSWRTAAREPEVTDLAEFLNRHAEPASTGHGASVIRIQGVDSLSHSCEYRVMPDRIEAGTYMVAADHHRGRADPARLPGA